MIKPRVQAISDIYFRVTANLPLKQGSYNPRKDFDSEWRELEKRWLEAKKK